MRGVKIGGGCYWEDLNSFAADCYKYLISSIKTYNRNGTQYILVIFCECLECICTLRCDQGYACK